MKKSRILTVVSLIIISSKISNKKPLTSPRQPYESHIDKATPDKNWAALTDRAIICHQSLPLSLHSYKTGPDR